MAKISLIKFKFNSRWQCLTIFTSMSLNAHCTTTSNRVCGTCLRYRSFAVFAVQGPLSGTHFVTILQIDILKEILVFIFAHYYQRRLPLSLRYRNLLSNWINIGNGSNRLFIASTESLTCRISHMLHNVISDQARRRTPRAGLMALKFFTENFTHQCGMLACPALSGGEEPTNRRGLNNFLSGAPKF